MRIRRNESHEELEARLNSLHRVPKQGGLTEYEKRMNAPPTLKDKIKDKLRREKHYIEYVGWGNYIVVPMTIFSIIATGIFGVGLLIVWFVMLVQNPGVGAKTTDELRRERWEYEIEQDRIENQRIQEERAYKDLKSMTK